MVYASIQRTSYEEVNATPVKHPVLRGYNQNDIEKGLASGEHTSLFVTSSTSSSLLYSPINTSHMLKQANLNISILALGIIFIVGVTVGAYLLLEQDRAWPTSQPFELVERDFWGAQNLPYESSLLDSLNVFNVMVTHTRGERCVDSRQCILVVRDIQKKSNETHKSDIPYNFLIGGDGQTYEGRGWRYESGFDYLPIKNRTLTIAFIGDFTHQLPTDHQLEQAIALINESINRKKLSPSYRIFGVRNITISSIDGAALYEHISKNWHSWDNLIDVGNIQSMASLL